MPSNEPYDWGHDGEWEEVPPRNRVETYDRFDAIVNGAYTVGEREAIAAWTTVMMDLYDVSD